jgi:tetratricopeptide (TPR) repeat protein
VRPAVVPASRSLARALLCLALGAFVGGATACGGTSRAQEEAQAIKQESSAKTLFEKGRVAAAIGDLTRAEQYFVAAIKAGADERKVIHPLLVACITDQRFPAALEYAEQYLYRYPNDLNVRFVAGSIHAVLGQPERARELLESVARGRPESPEVHYALATVLRQGGHTSQADRHDIEYLRLDPRGEHAAQARARLTQGNQ